MPKNQNPFLLSINPKQKRLQYRTIIKILCNPISTKKARKKINYKKKYKFLYEMRCESKKYVHCVKITHTNILYY
jgi:hypothetical protein